MVTAEKLAFANLTLRHVTDADQPFLEALYASIREPELIHAVMSPNEKSQFLAMQFRAQQHHYFNHYCTEHFYMVEVEQKPAGRFFIDCWQQEIRIVDIALMPAFRSQGLGTKLLSQLFRLAKQTNRSVSIHVERNNPAKNLYLRLGFKHKSSFNEVYQLMEWTPEDAAD